MSKPPCTDGRRNNRPPVSGQFRPGVCPNPKGRKAGGRNKKTVVKDAFNTKVTVTVNGKQRKITRFEAGMEQIAVAFAQGDAKALINGIELLKRYGLLEHEDTAANDQLTGRDEPVMRHILERIRASTSLSGNEGAQGAPSTQPEV